MNRVVVWAALLAAAWTSPAWGQTRFVAHFHAAHGVHNHTGAGGQAWLTLSEDQQRLAYTIQLEQLTLKPVAADRVEPSDVFGIHLHLIVPDHPGPHILNIFGDPEEEDADLVVDYQAGRLWGVFDASDATRDPVTGELLPQFFPLTTKLIDDWIEHLMNNQLYLAIHTVGQGGGALLHGDVVLVPEPATVGLAALAAAWVLRRRGRSRRHTKFGDH